MQPTRTPSRGDTLASQILADFLGDRVGGIVTGWIGANSANSANAANALIAKVAGDVPHAPRGTHIPPQPGVRSGPHLPSDTSPGATQDHGHWVTMRGHHVYLTDDGLMHLAGPQSPGVDPTLPGFHQAVVASLAHPVAGPGAPDHSAPRTGGGRMVRTNFPRNVETSSHSALGPEGASTSLRYDGRAYHLNVGTHPDPSTGGIGSPIRPEETLRGATIAQARAHADQVVSREHARALAQYAAHHLAEVNPLGSHRRGGGSTAGWLLDYDRDFPGATAGPYGSPGSASPAVAPPASASPAVAPPASASPAVAPPASASPAVAPPVSPGAQPSAPSFPLPPAPAAPAPVPAAATPDWAAFFGAHGRVRTADLHGIDPNANLAGSTNPVVADIGDGFPANGGRGQFRNGAIPIAPGRSIGETIDPVTGNRTVAFFTEDPGPPVPAAPTAPAASGAAGAPAPAPAVPAIAPGANPPADVASYQVTVNSPSGQQLTQYTSSRPRPADRAFDRMRRVALWVASQQDSHLFHLANPPTAAVPYDTTSPAYVAAMAARDPYTAASWNLQANVIVDGVTARERHTYEMEWFGRSLDDHEYGEMVGAPDEALVRVMWNNRHGFTIDTQGPQITIRPATATTPAYRRAAYSQERSFSNVSSVSADANFSGFPGTRQPFRGPTVKQCYNAQFFVDPAPDLTNLAATGRPSRAVPAGLGTRVIGYQVAKLGALGFAVLHTGPIGGDRESRFGGGSGYYAWPRMGYQSSLDSGTIRYLATVKAAHDQEHAEETRRMARDPRWSPNGNQPEFAPHTQTPANPSGLPNPLWRKTTYSDPVPAPAGLSAMRDMATLMSTPEGRAYWKNYGNGTHGWFDLRPGSPEQQANARYLADSSVNLGPLPRGR